MPEEKVDQGQPAEVAPKIPPSPPVEGEQPQEETPKLEGGTAQAEKDVETIIEERLSALRKELQALKKALKKEEKEEAPSPHEALLQELESLWEIELSDLPKADRELLAKILPNHLSPLDRIRIVRGLRAAGKLGTAATANVGTRAPVSVTPAKPAEESPEDVARRVLSLRRAPKGGRVPPGWEGR